MLYYISKPKTHKLDELLVSGIKESDPEALFVESLEKSDICVFQKGWTRSEQCVTDYKNAWLYKIKRYDSHFYTEKWSIKL